MAKPHRTLLVLTISLSCSSGGRTSPANSPSQKALEVASYAATTYADSVVTTLHDLIRFRTVQQPGMDNADNPVFQAMTAYLEQRSRELGFDFTDHGAVVVIGLGDASDRLGVITHGDVQPANATKWAQDPFTLDETSEPGRLLGRGVEDDKGPIAAALYAMKALEDRAVPLERRIELVISYTEESDWAPFQEFLEEWKAPSINVALDSESPVVVAEKGWGAIFLRFPPARDAETSVSPGLPRLVSFFGGAFLSQIPEDAEAAIIGATPELERALRQAGERDTLVRYRIHGNGDTLVIQARGVSAHSSKPWDGVNAITRLANLLGTREWASSRAANVVQAVNDLVGTGDYGELFGDVAYSHDFMGPLTLSLTTLGLDGNELVAGINIRRPTGRTADQVDEAIRQAVDTWRAEIRLNVELSTIVGDPHYLERAPHIPLLLDIFRHYTGQDDAQPISIGGGTHARLVPNGVNFGPAMPGEPYTGHSEHEYISRKTLLLNLEMYTAMLVELAGAS